MVTGLSCVVLGSVWGFVIHLLPESDTLTYSPSHSLTVPPPRLPSSPPLSLIVPGVQDPATPPVTGRDVPVAHTAPSGRLVGEGGGPPFRMDLKCSMEIDSLCSEDDGERPLCLQRKATQLSAPCRPILRERLVRMKETMRQMRAACETDRLQYCREEPLGGGAIVQCLESHAQEVSDHCFQFLPKRGRLLN